MLGNLEIAAELGHGIDQIQRLIREDRFDARILDDIGDLAIAELKIDRHGDGAERSNAHERKDKFGAVARENADAVALTHAGRVKTVAAGRCRRLQVAIGKTAVMIDDRHGIRRSLMDEVMNKHGCAHFLYSVQILVILSGFPSYGKLLSDAKGR